MDDLLMPFYYEVNNNCKEFLEAEKDNFRVTGEDNKTKSEYIRTAAFFKDKESNESFYTSEQSTIILDTLDIVEDLINQEEYDVAQYILVSLQLVMGMDIKLNRIIVCMIRNNMKLPQFIDASAFEIQEENKMNNPSNENQEGLERGR